MIDGALTVTDLDRDGVAEVSFAYELACRSDVSPATYKLLVLEDGAKYILRGTTRVDHPAMAAWSAGASRRIPIQRAGRPRFSITPSSAGRNLR